MKAAAWLVAALAILVALVAPTIASPASRLFLLLFAGLGALVGARWLLRPPPYPAASVVGGTTPERTIQDLPEEYRRMAALLSRYRDPGPDLKLDPIALHLLRSVASQRLYQRHQLRLDVADHLPRIQPLLSAGLWQAVGPPPAGSSHQPAAVPARALGQLIEELERL